MGGLFSTSYDVQKVGQNVKGASKKRPPSSVSHEIKTTESGNNVFAKSDIEIIGPINELDDGGKKEDAKTVRIDETKTEVFEHAEVREDPPPPQISPEERKKQEDLMMAMVRGEIHPRDSVSEDANVIVKTIGSITALEAQAELANCSPSVDEENVSTPEEVTEKSSVTEDQDVIRQVVQVQVNNVSEELTTASSTQLDEESTVTNKCIDPKPSLIVAEELKCEKEVVSQITDLNVDEKQPGDENKVNVAANVVVHVRDEADPDNESLEPLTQSTEAVVVSEIKPEVDKAAGSPTENKVNVAANLNVHEREEVDPSNEPLEPLIQSTEAIVVSEIKPEVDKEVGSPTENKVNVAGDIILNVREEVHPLKPLPQSTDLIVALQSKPEADKEVNEEAGLGIKVDELPESASTVTGDVSVAAEIQSVEEKAKKLKEKIINFSGTSKNKEYDELYQALVTNILKLDDLSCSSAELDNERRRVIKILQQCMQNLERKIDSVKNVESDSE